MRFIYLFIYVLLVGLSSCTDEPEQYNFTVSIKNNTNTDLEVKFFYENTLQTQKILNQGETSKICDYYGEFFIGLSGCVKDSVVVDFKNSKGYIDKRLDNSQNTYRFPNGKSIFLQGMGFKNINNTYEFVITQEDYENAHELPEE